jgi:hypothetical protein
VPYWTKWYGGISADQARSIVATSDGGYAITGYSYSAGGEGGSDVFLVKTDSGGNLLWQNWYGGTGDDFGQSVVATSDGGFAIVGWSSSNGTHGGSDAFLVKTASDGTQQWAKWYGGTLDDWGYSVVATSDGGYAITGFSTSTGTHGASDVFLVKTDVEQGLARVGTSANFIVLYRGISDAYWNYVRVRIWKIH